MTEERKTGHQIDQQYWPEPGEMCSNPEHDHVPDYAAGDRAMPDEFRAQAEPGERTVMDWNEHNAHADQEMPDAEYGG